MPAMPLLETVKQNSAQMAAPSQPGMMPTGGSQTQQTASLVATAQTGKDLGQGGATGGTAKLSSLGERLANVNTLMSGQALQQSAGLQGEAQQQQAEAQQQQFGGQMRMLSQEHLNQVEQFNTQLSGIMQQKAEDIQRMTVADDKSKIEQVGLMLRLGNETYIDQLNAQASKARLDNAAHFQLALSQSVFAQETDLLGSSLQFRNYLRADERQARDQLANIDLDFAVQMATTDNKAAAATTMWSGIGSIGGAAVAAGAGALASGSTATPPDGNLVMQSAGDAPQAGVPTVGDNQSFTQLDAGTLGAGVSPYSAPSAPAYSGPFAPARG